MAADIKEKKFIEDVLRFATLLISAQESLTIGVDVYVDRSYGASMEEEDFAEYGLTKAQFIDIATFVSNFNNMLDNQAPTVADYRKILNILRTDK